MSKKALRKDFFREIKNTFNRFASILLIVALGVAFFSGVRATQPDMWLSGDALFDSLNMMDARVVSTLGLTDEDLEAIKKVEGVKAAEGVKTLEVLSEKDVYEEVVKLISSPETINMVKVSKGRMPEKEGEILLDETLRKHGYDIGDTIRVRSGTSKDIDDSLSRDSFTIVGFGTESYFMSLTRGTSSVGTGSLTGFAIIMPEVFKSDIYTEIVTTFEDALAMNCYSKEYGDYADKIVENIEAIADERCKIRYASVLDDANGKIDDAQKEIDDAKKKLDDAKKELDDGERKIADARVEIADNEKKISDGWTEIASNEKTLADGIKEINDNEKLIKDGLVQLANEKTNLNGQLSELETNLSLLKQQKQAVEAGWITGDLTSINANIAAAEAGIAQMKAGLNLIDSKKAEADAGLKVLAEKRLEIEEGQKTLAEKKAELKDAEEQLAEGKRTLAKSEAELADGRREYNEKKADADKEIADGQSKIDDSRADLADIKEPKWYVLDRDYLQTCVEYGQDAERIGNIGKVFPLIFFIVAALVSLTTMTRMVEEQRVQIGSLKALGYSGWDVAKKYIYYALLASVIGSVIGVVVGQWLFPTVIIKAYGILYVNVKDLVTPMDPYCTASAAIAAIVCTVGATLLACIKELKAVPASLMRPEAPKSGKRILLERITPIWSRLSFTRKATFRNLFRYKKRFFMTIFGIGGCMALLLVGYGIKDAILCIGTRQFGEISVYQSYMTTNKDAKEEEIKAIYEQLDNDETVTSYMNFRESSIDISANNVTKSGYLVIPEDRTELSKYYVLKGRLSKEHYELDDDSIVISEKLASLLSVKEGDTVTLKDDDTSYHEARVAHITENYFQHYVYMSSALYERLYGQEPEYNNIVVDTIRNDEEFEEDFGKRYLDLKGISGVNFISTTAGQIANMLRSMDVIIYVLIISAGLLAFVVLYNLNNINITERRRELATIKVLGFYDRETAMYVYRENVFLTIFGIIFGLVIGRILHIFVVLTAEIDLLMFAREIQPLSYVKSIGFTILFTIIINVVMFYQLKKINMVESLKSVE